MATTTSPPLFDLSNMPISGSAGADTLVGLPGNDFLQGLGGNDSLLALGGDDTLSGNEGDDTLQGGAGGDTYLFFSGGGHDLVMDPGVSYKGSAKVPDTELDILDMPNLQSTDVLRATYRSRFGGADLIIEFKSGERVTLDNQFGFTSSAASPDQAITDIGGVDEVHFSDGVIWSRQQLIDQALAGVPYPNDIPLRDLRPVLGTASTSADELIGLAFAANDIQGDAGDDTLWGGAFADTLFGGAGHDVLMGLEGDDLIFGDEGRDTLMGGAGEDTLYGDGNDTLDGGAGNDVYVDFSSPGGVNTYVFGRGSGVDTLLVGRGELRLGAGITADDLVVKAVVPARALVDLPPNVSIGYLFELHLSIKGSEDEFISTGQWWSDDGQSDALTAVVFADGTRWDLAELTARAWAGTAGNDVIQGFVGLDNVLSGEAGQDRLTGGDKQDLLTGGEGADSLFGRKGNDTLQGGSGDDWLDGGLGNNELVGGAGNDVYLFERGLAGSSVVDASPVGNDASRELETIRMGSGIRGSDIKLVRQGDDLIVESRYAVGFGTRVERMLVRGNFGLDAGAQTFSLIDNIQFVGDGTVWDAAEISRRTQNVYGLATEGDDELDGDISANTLSALGGQDTLLGFGGNDVLSGGQGADWLDGSGGQDTLDGGLGADTMIGGADNDFFYVDDLADQVVEIPGRDFAPGIDTVATNLADYTLPPGVENLVMGGKSGDSPELRNILSGKAGVRHGVGNGDANLMTGDLGSEYFEGLGGNDLLRGGAGDDTLAGGVGDDSLEGGDGNDTYILRAKDEGLDPFRHVNIDSIWESSADGSGIDTVDTDYDSFVAPPNVEQVFTTGTSVTGNGLNNLLRGGTGHTELYGADGDDTLEGGGGGDSYVGGKGHDLLVASKPGSNDYFQWGLGDGADTLRDAGGNDHLFISGNVRASQLWFAREGDALKVSIIGTADSFTVEGWYQGTEHQIEDIVSLNVAKVQQLVDAMASFPPPQGQTSLPADVAAQLAPVMAAVWG